jgi:hypothetical protein
LPIADCRFSIDKKGSDLGNEELRTLNRFVSADDPAFSVDPQSTIDSPAIGNRQSSIGNRIGYSPYFLKRR